MNTPRLASRSGVILVVTAAAFALVGATAPRYATRHAMSQLYTISQMPMSIVAYNPNHTISGDQTKVDSAMGLAVDRLSGDIVVVNHGDRYARPRGQRGQPGSIVVLPDGNGNVPARSVIKCSRFEFWGVAFDNVGNIIVGNQTDSTVLTFAHNATGCPKPLSVLSGSHTQIGNPIGVAVNRAGETVVDNYNGGISTFAAGASGNVAPLRTIYGSNTGLTASEGVALDRNGNIYASTYSPATIVEFDARANGNVAPLRTISGPSTMLDAVLGIAVDRKGYIYVANYGNDAILVFDPNASGNVAPVKVISQALPFAVAVPQ